MLLRRRAAGLSMELRHLLPAASRTWAGSRWRAAPGAPARHTPAAGARAAASRAAPRGRRCRGWRRHLHPMHARRPFTWPARPCRRCAAARSAGCCCMSARSAATSEGRYVPCSTRQPAGRWAEAGRGSVGKKAGGWEGAQHVAPQLSPLPPQQQPPLLPPQQCPAGLAIKPPHGGRPAAARTGVVGVLDLESEEAGHRLVGGALHVLGKLRQHAEQGAGWVAAGCSHAGSGGGAHRLPVWPGSWLLAAAAGAARTRLFQYLADGSQVEVHILRGKAEQDGKRAVKRRPLSQPELRSPRTAASR